jgi:hypothetical protein
MPRKKNQDSDTFAENKPKVLSPFDILKMMFTNQEEFNKLPIEVLGRNYYIINMQLSVKFPLQAAVFNHYKINPGEVVKCWQDFIVRQGLYGGYRIPQWVYEKGKAKANEEKVAKKKFTDKFIKQYCDHYGVSIKDVKYCLDSPYDILNNGMYNDLAEYKKKVDQLEKLSKMSMTDFQVGKNKE